MSDIPKYNHMGGINEVWAYYDSLQYNKEDDTRYSSSDDGYVRGGIIIYDDEDEEDYNNKYDAAFEFLKKHVQDMSDKEIALEVLKRLG